MTWVEMYTVALVVTPITAAVIAFMVCRRDRQKADRAAGHGAKGPSVRLGAQ
jgi:hypothetical protein